MSWYTWQAGSCFTFSAPAKTLHHESSWIYNMMYLWMRLSTASEAAQGCCGKQL